MPCGGREENLEVIWGSMKMASRDWVALRGPLLEQRSGVLKLVLPASSPTPLDSIFYSLCLLRSAERATAQRGSQARPHISCSRRARQEGLPVQADGTTLGGGGHLPCRS